MLWKQHQSLTAILSHYYAIFTSKTYFFTTAILPDKKTGVTVDVWRHQVQKATESTLYGTKSNHESLTDSAMGIAIGGEE